MEGPQLVDSHLDNCQLTQDGTRPDHEQGNNIHPGLEFLAGILGNEAQEPDGPGGAIAQSRAIGPIFDERGRSCLESSSRRWSRRDCMTSMPIGRRHVPIQMS